MNHRAKPGVEALALRVRERIVRLATGGGCFLGASLSCVDIIVALYTTFLNLRRDNLTSPERDVFLLSKGHDVPALYATLAELGVIDGKRLANHLKSNDDIYWHPNTAVSGVEFHSGSLGHLLAVGVGIALDLRLRRQSARVVVLLGDGELNEGSVWEALLVACAKRLSNLLLIVDRNGFQANVRTEELVPLEPLERKFAAFGCGVVRVNGHDLAALEAALAWFPYTEKLGQDAKGGAPEGPSVLIADTVRGKGLPSIEARADRWFCNFTPGEVEALVEELHGAERARLTSQPLAVR
ncbi:MAG TPA: 1-deoxy-D-xylulose-5-phosphate synthase N-terminal domain-containing protein [Thermoanaerobaculaceae bacterium]|nr:1-deoxy-D-xylulose-5-phosphate synthase N-terminal domain-containing protein [Thermoanaerobaculaceae bacterium]